MYLIPKYYINTVLQNSTASEEKGVFQSIFHPFSCKNAAVLSVEREAESFNVNTVVLYKIPA